jgi:uncharacterized protein YpmS
MSFWELIFVLLIFIPIILLWVFTLFDVFKREDLSGAAKALWAIAVLLLPVIGMIVYFVTRPPTPYEPPDPAVAQVDSSAEATTSSTADQLTQLSDLHDSGKLSDEEFASAKTELLGAQDDG